MDDRAAHHNSSSEFSADALLEDRVLKSTALLSRAPSRSLPPPRATPTRARPRRFGRRAMKFVRRTHLYAGLALVPFVVLYGLTAFLFNHPEVWSTSEARHLQPGEVNAAGRVPFESARTLADGVVRELSNPEWSLDSATEPRLEGRTFLTASVDATRYSFIIDAPNGGARVFARPEQELRNKNELFGPDGSKLRVGDEVIRSTQTAASALVSSGGEDVPWRVRSAPRLEFGLVRAETEPYRATYDLRDGSLEVSPAAEPAAARTARSFLLRLHTAHGYPSGYGIGFWWAIVVDVMAIAMVAWAGTGLLMWWQMRNLRRAGLITLAACAVGTAALVAAQ